MKLKFIILIIGICTCIGLYLLVTNNKNTQTIEYSVADHYFVKNNIKKLDSPKITTQEKFDSIFGAAPVMGKNGLPTKIDFNKQYVIAIIKEETNYDTEIIPLYLEKASKGYVVFAYKVKKGKKQNSYTTLPCLIIVVNSTDTDYVILSEQ